MAKIILEGHSYYNNSITKKEIYSLNDKENHHARILIDVKSELCCTQMQFVSYESKSDYWTNEELLIAFNKAYIHIKRFVETDGPLKIFTENLFHPESEELQTNELKDMFQIEIPENKENVKKINVELLRLKETQINFDKCKNKLFEVIGLDPDLLNRQRYNINSIIDYLYSVVNAGVVTSSNNENIRHIRSAFDELGGRKNIRNNTYQTIRNMAQNDIYSLEFPKYFKANLSNIEINKILDEIY